MRSADSRAIESFRLTGQLTARNRVSFSHEHQHRCSGSTITLSGEGCRTRDDNWVASGTPPPSPETFPGYHDFPYNVTQATWSSPVTSRLLLEAGYSRFQYLWAGFGIAPPDGFNSLIPVTEQSTMYGQGNYSYRGLYDPLGFAYADNDASPTNWRATASYVTGAHNMKVGYQGSYQKSLQGRVANQTQLQYTVQQRRPERLQLLPRAALGAERSHRDSGRCSCRTSGREAGSRCRAGCATTARGAWLPPKGNGTTLTSRFNPQPISFPRDRQRRRATTTSRREWAPPTTCLATARRRSR